MVTCWLQNTFYYFEYPLDINNVDIDKAMISTKVFLKKDFKYFTGYKDDEKVKPLCIMLSIKAMMKKSVCKSSFKIIKAVVYNKHS